MTEFEDERGIGSVKAAISKYGGTINQGSGVKNKSHKDTTGLQEKESKAQELHTAKNKVDKINENRKMAESVKSQAELELLHANKIVRELTAQIEELKTKAKQKSGEFQTMEMLKRVHDQSAPEPSHMEVNQHTEVLRELEILKREVSKVKLDMAHAIEEKSHAEKEADAAGLRLRSFMNTAEQLRRKIEEAYEEEVLVELAQIQARKELAAIEAQKKEEEEKFKSKIQETRKKIQVLRDEVDQVQQLEEVLAITHSDADMLQNELKLIKEMDKQTESSRGSLSENSDLQTATKNLKAAKKELESIKAGSFQLMKSMDLVRIELNNLLKEKDQIEEAGAKTEKSIEKLNSKLLRAKDKLEATRASEEQATSMLSSFDLSLQNMEKEKEEAEKDKKCVVEETSSMRDEIQKTESAIDLIEDKLWATMKELEADKKSEENALTKLKTVAENAAIARASKKTTTITISKFEYDYLTECATGAKEIAGKKAAAARAWVEALRSNEKEMQIKTAVAERQIRELRQKEEEEFNKVKNTPSGKELAELEIQKQRDQGYKGVRRRSMTENNNNSTPARQTNVRRSIGSPAGRRPIISTTLTVKRKRKAMHKLAKYFANNQVENEKSVPLDESQ